MDRLPEGWVPRSLAEVTAKPIVYGIVQAGPDLDEGVPYIKSSDIANRIEVGSLQKTSKEIAAKYKRSEVFPGDIIFSLRGNIGESCIIPSYIELANLTQGTARISVKKGVSNIYIHYALQSEGIAKRIHAVSKGSTFREISLEELRKIKIPIPPLLEQRKIAAILGTWDEAIAQVEALIAALKQRKKGLMQRLLTGKVRFPGFEGEWEEVELGEIATIRRGASPRPIKDPKWFAESGRGWVRIADVTREPTRFLNETTQYLSPLGVEKSVQVDPGGLIMSIAATIGVPKIVNIPVCVHDGFVVIDEFESKASTDFLFHYLGFITASLANTGQPGTQKNINSALVRKIKVPGIVLAEKNKIAELLNHCDEEIVNLGFKREALTKQKKGLMQRLLTGQIRVNVDQPD